MTEGRNVKLQRNSMYKDTGIYRDKTTGGLFMFIVSNGKDVTEFVSGWIPITNSYTSFGTICNNETIEKAGLAKGAYEYVCSIEELGDVLKNKLNAKAEEEDEIPF